MPLNSTNPFEAISQELFEIKNLLLELKSHPLNEVISKNYSVQVVSKKIGCCDLTTYSLIRRGIIPAKKIGRKYIISNLDLENAMKDVKSLKYRRHD